MENSLQIAKLYYVISHRQRLGEITIHLVNNYKGKLLFLVKFVIPKIMCVYNELIEDLYIMRMVISNMYLD